MSMPSFMLKQNANVVAKMRLKSSDAKNAAIVAEGR